MKKILALAQFVDKYTKWEYDEPSKRLSFEQKKLLSEIYQEEAPDSLAPDLYCASCVNTLFWQLLESYMMLDKEKKRTKLLQRAAFNKTKFEAVKEFTNKLEALNQIEIKNRDFFLLSLIELIDSATQDESFTKYLKSTRDEFSSKIAKLYSSASIEERVAIEDLLIAYDQMAEKF